MRLMCRFLGHHRSRRFASFNVSGDRWESHCTRCKIRLVRLHDGAWQPKDLNAELVEETVPSPGH